MRSLTKSSIISASAPKCSNFIVLMYLDVYELSNEPLSGPADRKLREICGEELTKCPELRNRRATQRPTLGYQMVNFPRSDEGA